MLYVPVGKPVGNKDLLIVALEPGAFSLAQHSLAESHQVVN